MNIESIIETYLGVTFGENCSTEEITGIFCIIGRLINYLLLIVGAVSLVMFVVGGLQYMISGGDEKALTTAKATLTYSVLGLFIVLLSSVIVSIVLSLTGLTP
jgi:hypothetical protein